jgi:integrase
MPRRPALARLRLIGMQSHAARGEAVDPVGPVRSAVNRMTQMVRNCVRAAGLRNIGSCHLFRHAMATQMPENGADVRFIQAMLSHADIKTTQVCTHG